MASKAVLTALIGLEESPWSDLRGKPLDERGLAKRLSAYGIKSTLVRLGESVVRGYRREDLFDAWCRYLPSPDTNATSVTSATDQAIQERAVTDVADVTLLPDKVEIDADGWTFNLEG